MYKIVEKYDLAPSIFLARIDAPRVAKAAKPGQFVIVIVDETGERLPLTIADFDIEKGTVDLVVQVSGKSTKKFDEKETGDYIKDFVGPLGVPSEYINEDLDKLRKEKWLFVGGGVGVAPVFPQIRWFKENDLDFDVIIGAKNKDFVIWEDKYKELTDNVYVATDDGSYGFKGMVTDLIDDLVENQGKKYDHVVAIGPMIMMKFVTLTCKKHDLPVTVSLNPIMVDGTGMCGACRVTIDGKTQFACVHGPEFDGHKVNFDEAMARQRQYASVE